MKASQIAAMQAGREKARAARSKGAIPRVRDWRRWSKAGAIPAQIPEVPSSEDYKLVREWEDKHGKRVQ